jgi:glycosyltransferase involved in cell wall biosynthesis
MSRGLRVAVCLPQVPFERGGAEIHAESLVQALNERGHEATLVTLPYKWYPNTVLLESALCWRMTDLTEANGRPIDVAVGTKFPSYLVRHPRKVVWLFHQFRQAYDMHGTRFAQFGDDAEGAAMREAIRHMDAVALTEARALFTTSRNNAERLRRYNDLAAEVLPAPPQGLNLAWRGDEGYVLSVGRLDAAKRVDLLLEALALAPTVSATIAGDGPDRRRLEDIAARLGLESRVRFRGRVAAEELADLYGRCRGVFYAPHDEDYGFVPLEAHLAGKAVITTTDAGGPLEVVEDGVTGLVVGPSHSEIAAALSRLHGDPALARRLGEEGSSRAKALSWDTVVQRLLAGAGA